MTRQRFLLLTTILLAGCNREKPFISADAAWILEAPDSLELLAMEPSPEIVKEPAADRLHGYKILGRAPITDRTEQQRLAAALRDSKPTSDRGVAGCFNPRHGLIATRQNKTLDLVICFECGSMNAWESNKLSSIHITRAGEPTFNAALKSAGLQPATTPAP